jgi:hypothetical protein
MARIQPSICKIGNPDSDAQNEKSCNDTTIGATDARPDLEEEEDAWADEDARQLHDDWYYNKLGWSKNTRAASLPRTYK